MRMASAADFWHASYMLPCRAWFPARDLSVHGRLIEV
jgi:hypothetical protein